MKVARLYSFTDIRIEDHPIPTAGPGEALIRTRASGICSGDVMPWYIEKKAPLVLGHEPSGEVVSLGEGTEGFKPGDRVAVHHHAPCGRCSLCQRGNTVQCPTWRSSNIIPGGMAEYILIPAINLQNDTLILPDSVSFEDGTLVEPLGCVMKSIKRSGFRAGDSVLIIGMGVMGMLHLLAFKAMDAGRITCSDMIAFRLNHALKLGADEAIDASRGPLDIKADIVIVGPNSAAALQAGLRCASPGGTVVMFTPVRPGEGLTIDPNDLYFKDINLVTSYSTGPAETRAALELIASGAVRADMVVTHRFAIDQTAEAYRITAEARDSLKCLVTFL